MRSNEEQAKFAASQHRVRAYLRVGFLVVPAIKLHKTLWSFPLSLFWPSHRIRCFYYPPLRFRQSDALVAKGG